MKSLRNYLTNSQLQEYQPSILTVDETLLIRAEFEIDLVLATFYQGSFSKAFKNEVIFNNCLVNASTIQITSFNTNDGYLAKTVVEILSGANSGNRYFVTTQTNNVLTLTESTGLTNETCDIRVSQLAKAPFQKDCISTSQTYYKFIDERIKQAVAYQYVYLLENNSSSHYAQTSYNVSGASYSENFDVNIRANIKDRISVYALDSLSFLTTQYI